MKYVPGKGNDRASLLILGEAPSYRETEKGEPFVGPSGKELDRLLSDAGINRSSCWLTNVCKYEVPMQGRGKKIPFSKRAESIGINLQEQIDDLQREINTIQPNCILALGGTALWALTGKNKISEWRGSIIKGMGRKVVGTYHPAHLIHQAGGEIKGYWNRQIMILDMKRALEESRSPNLNLPYRNLQICKSSAQFLDFIKRHEKNTKLSIDIEGHYCVPVCVGLAFTKHEGLTIPLWNTHGFSNIADNELVSIWILLSKLLNNPRFKKTGQNFKFDEDKLNRLGFTIDRLSNDTMLKSFAINPELPKSQEFNQSIYTREPYYKNEEMYGYFDKKTKQFIFNPTNLMMGCARDACVALEIDDKMDADLDELGMRKFYENFLMELHPMYLDIESEGFCINYDRRDELIKKYIEWDERLRYELFHIVGEPVNVNSPKQVQILLEHNLGLKLPNGTGEDELTQIILSPKTKAEHKKICELVLEDRRVRKTLSTYLFAKPDFDGKMKTTYFLCLETGRTSTGQQDPPIRPTIEWRDEDNKKKDKVLGTAFQTMTKHGDVGQDLRSMYEPEPGYVFLQADSAQAEARVVFLLADDEQALHDIDHHDYHALTASWFFGGTEDDYSKKKLGYESPVRFIGKTLRHAGHLGAKAPRATKEVNTSARKYKVDVQITEQFAKASLDKFHAMQPKIRNNFHNGIADIVGKTRILTAGLPFGIDAPHGGKRTFFERYGDELFRQAYSYIPQRSISDNTKMSGLRIRKRIKGIRIILESHDSLLFMIREREVDDFAPVIKEEMERPISFEACSIPRRSLIVPCELEIGYNYQELSKFKFRLEAA